MPIGVNGATVRDEEGDYNIYINARISSDKFFRLESSESAN